MSESENLEQENTEDIENISDEELEEKTGRFKLLVEKRLEKKYGETISQLNERIAAFEAQQEEAERAKRSKIENLERDLSTVASQKAELEQAMEQVRLENMRTKWIYTNAPSELPQIYLEHVAGNTEEELAESLAEIQKIYEADFNARQPEKTSIGTVPPRKTNMDLAGKSIQDMTAEEYALWKETMNLK